MTNFKDEAYYESIDKRTKEYKQWSDFKQAQIDKELKGVGDVIDKITEATGIKKVIKDFFGEDCGCDKRKDLINDKLPFGSKAVNCLDEEDYLYLKSFFSRTRDRIDGKNQQRIIGIYNFVFGKNEAAPSGCVNCSHKGFIKNVNKLHAYFTESQDLVNELNNNDGL
ncbi:MAG: hypothetical protein HQ473_07505 [Cryomorphaceae bacterium]|nr:hypothetical protein [Cryomorphaceae bacterium]